MADTEIQQRGTIGKYWRQFRVGDRSGAPLAEWAYITPRFPKGIRQSELQRASPEIQRETAIVWFNLNLEPYALGEGPYFGFDHSDAGGQPPQAGRTLVGGPLFSAVPPNAAPYGTQPYTAAPYAGRPIQPRIGGFDQAVLAPAPLDAAAVLSGEFGAILPKAAVDEIARGLPGQWMWKQPPAPRPIDPTGAPPDWTELSGAILVRLDALEEALRDLRPAPGEIGHNRPPEGFGLTPEDEREAQAAISHARAIVASEGEVSGTEIQATSDKLEEIGAKLGTWALGQLKIFSTEAIKSAGTETGKAVVTALLATKIIHELAPLLEQAARLFGHH